MAGHMNNAETASLRPAQRSDRWRLEDFLARTSPGGVTLSAANLRHHVVALSGEEVVGACAILPAPGRCAAVLAPQLETWDDALASQLLRAAADLARTKFDARLIQSLVEPQGSSPLAAALQRAGFEVLATLSYQRRDVRPDERDLPLPDDLEWQRYWPWRHRLFAETVRRTYEASLDCPKLAGLRTVDDALATHKRTGLFTPDMWHVAVRGGEVVGVCLVNNLQGRGEVTYLGVTAGARQKGLGRVLVERAVRDTARLGLPMIGLAVDVANAPAMRLYEATGFREIRRRLAYFIPATRLESLHAE